MKRKLIPILLMILAGAFTLSVTAQPCPPDYTIPIGTSACIQVCAFQQVVVTLEGGASGPEAAPVLIMQAGCAAANSNCDVACTPIVPPNDLQFGGDPYYPDQYYGASNCIIIHMYWGHDNVWYVVIFPLCTGCFCVTYDHQLAVELSSFTALPGDGEVVLNWITASEANNNHFDIERDHVKIAEVAATNSATGSIYTYTDQGLTNGRTYRYDLFSVDANGNRENKGFINSTPTFSSDVVVTSYGLHQNYPNPFNPETSIAFDLVQAGTVKLAIYSVLGENVATLVSGPMSSGRHTVVFNGTNLTSGVYLYRLEVNGFTDTKKLVLMK